MSETLSTLAGGNGGHAFTISIPTGAVLKAIHLFAGDYVDGLQLVVGDAAGHEMTLPPAGGTGGSAATFELADDEVLAGISGRFGWYVDNIQFHTNKRTSPLYGGLGGEHTFYIPVPADQVVAGVYGRAHNFIDAIGLILQDRPQPIAAPEAAAPRPEDLQKVEGIGPKIAAILVENGIPDLAALAQTSESRLRDIIAAAGKRYRMANPATWPEQAALGAAGNWDALAALQARLKGGRRG